MAFRTTLSRNAGKHISAYGSVLDRFMVSHAPSLASSSPSSSSSSSSSTTTPASSSASTSASLFEPSKSTTTGCWAPPKYSLRRQAKLVKEAALTGQLSLLPDGPKTTRIQQRLHRLAKTHTFEQTARQYQYIPQDVSTPAAVRPASLGERAVRPSQRVSTAEREAALMTARLQVRDVGPYSGRAKVFKGSRVDKGKNKRRDEVKNKLGAMQQTVHDWHSTQTDAKNKLKPGLPF
ncbi:hypothetical protein EX895_002161 [Sporisorium graminicola]|uniref:Large ribosomal subunit protein mL59 domain-containing protein n=1 Tax=Sporisorium graminicola TaxID=280036 RepID=A0A4U7KWQ0_9BASI|nr:hypothetical protein EX895_002161 [Sporisorium graminicola]TKY88920.1 hypothetical protein EX895_002161 [Sporisorium graminicola]